jgi:endonuclease/exonuclease/phosphatase (EEP) superfamily protein YafD
VEDRRDQVEAILDAVRHQPGPSIVAGDFNSQSVAPWFEEDGFAWLTRGLPGTSRGLGVWLSFDHVFTKGFRAAAVAPAAGYVETEGISGHRALWVRLRPIVWAFGPLMPSRP